MSSTSSSWSRACNRADLAVGLHHPGSLSPATCNLPSRTHAEHQSRTHVPTRLHPKHGQGRTGSHMGQARPVTHTRCAPHDPDTHTRKHMHTPNSQQPGQLGCPCHRTWTKASTAPGASWATTHRVSPSTHTRRRAEGPSLGPSPTALHRARRVDARAGGRDAVRTRYAGTRWPHHSWRETHQSWEWVSHRSHACSWPAGLQHTIKAGKGGREGVTGQEDAALQGMRRWEHAT